VQRIIAIFSILALLSACAAPVAPDLAQKKANQDAIRNIKNVEIFYHDDQYAVVDLGGSSLAGLSGILGPIGLLAGLAADATSKLTVTERADARGKEFTESIHQHFPDQDLNLDFANQLAGLIQENGHTVKVVKIKRPQGKGLMSEKMPEGVPQEAGDTSVVLRITTGYGASSATADYRPLVMVEYALARDPDHILVHNEFTVKDGEKTYATYQGLLASDAEAREQLKTTLASLAPQVYKSMFDLSMLNKE